MTAAGSESLRASLVFNLGGANILVVDDSAIALTMTTEALRGFGIETRYVCSNAAEAIAVLMDNPVDLLIVDCDMPGMNGRELVQWIRNAKQGPNANVPIIMTASHVRQSTVSEVRACGASFLIYKPFKAEVLLNYVIRAARDHRPFVQTADYCGPDRRAGISEPREEDERRRDMMRVAALRARRLDGTPLPPPPPPDTSTVFWQPRRSRISTLIDEPGGLSVGVALIQARSHLHALQTQSQEIVSTRIAELASLKEPGPGHPHPRQVLAEAYRLSSAVIDAASPFERVDLCTAASGLCDLIDAAPVDALFDWRIVTVHARALRLIAGLPPEADAERAEVLANLRLVLENRTPLYVDEIKT